MSGNSLPKRHLRFHYGGTFKDTGNVPNKLRCYSGGSKVDSKGWDGEEVCLLDLAKEVFKLVVVPEGKNIALSWFQLVREKDYINQRLPIVDDPDVLYFWANSKQDSRNFLHLYVEFVGPTYLGSINRQLQTQVQPCLQPTPPPPTSQLGLTPPPPPSSQLGPTPPSPIVDVPPSSSEVDIVEEFPPSTRQKLNVRRRGKGKSPVKAKSPLKPRKTPVQPKKKSIAKPTRWSTRLATSPISDDCEPQGNDVVHHEDIEVVEEDPFFLHEVESTFASIGVEGNEDTTVMEDNEESTVNLDSDDSIEDLTYALNDTGIEGIVQEQVREERPRTRSSGPLPDIELETCDAQEDYESPYSGSETSDTEDDRPLTTEEIARAKAQIEEEEQRDKELEGEQVIQVKNAGFEKVNDKEGGEKDPDIEWIHKTSRVEDEEYEQTGTGKKWHLFVDQRWQDIFECRHYLRTHAIKKKFVMRLKKNDSNRIVAECKGSSLDGMPCKWKVSIGRMNNDHTMRVGTLNDVHICVSKSAKTNPTARAPWIAKKIGKAMRVHHRSFKVRDIIGRIWAKYTIDIKYWQAWHALQMALELVHGNYEDSYCKLPELCRQILASNPGSIAALSRNDQFNTFDFCCVSFKASVDGFVAGCRPLIGLDGCFLKGKYGGVCLSVVALDGNNGMFPLAIFVCVRENLQNWQRFLEIMQPQLTRHKEKLTIMSDRQKGLQRAVANVFPGHHQRFCFRHMVANMKRYFSGVHDLAWAASKAYSRSYWNLDMEEMHKIDAGATQYLMDEEPCKWARSWFDQECKSEHTTNNWSEAFNARILQARDKPVHCLISMVISLLMKLQYERRKTARTWDQNGLVPRVLQIIEDKKAKVCEYTCSGSEDHLYQVGNYTGKHWIVDITLHTCTCGEWELTGIPCIHAVRVLNFTRPDWKSYCSPYMTVEAYKRVYEGGIKPILHESDWPKITDVILPPIKSRKPGRPAVARRRGLDEGPIRYGGKKQVRCSICREYGHNKKTCTGGCPDHAAYVAATSKGPAKRGATDAGGRPRTRPRKIDYGVPTENIADDPAFSEFIAQFEPVVTNRSKGKGKKTYKGKGKRRGPSQHTFNPTQVPFDPTFYGYDPSQHTFDPTPQPSTPMQYSMQFRNHPTPTMPGIQFRNPTSAMPGIQFRNPTPTIPGVQFGNPTTISGVQFRNPNHAIPPSWIPPTNVNQPYMRPPQTNRQVFRPQTVFPLHGSRTARVAALLGLNEDGSSQGTTGSSSQASTSNAAASTSNAAQPRWRI